VEGRRPGNAGVQAEQAAGLGAAVRGIRSRPVLSVIKAGGAYVLGGAKSCPQASGPLFNGSSGCVSAGGSGWFRLFHGYPGGMGDDGEERVGEHGQGDVPVPGAVAADLVVVQAGLVLRFREAVLHSPRAPAIAASSARIIGRGEWQR
jgi:hypothetical protein